MADTTEKTGYFSGMTNNSPPGTDASMKPPPGNVNDKPVRTGVAANQKTLGPRTA
jgi:hypothetical protein